MTIDEFMRDIAPKMRPGWVAMDEDENWCWFLSKPDLGETEWLSNDVVYLLLECFVIDPVDDWKKSKRKVGK